MHLDIALLVALKQLVIDTLQNWQILWASHWRKKYGSKLIQGTPDCKPDWRILFFFFDTKFVFRAHTTRQSGTERDIEVVT